MENENSLLRSFINMLNRETFENESFFLLYSNLTIGKSEALGLYNNFDGCLDSISFIDRAKNATEILNDATEVVYLSFDNSNLLDSGPLLINGTGANYSFTCCGKVNKGLSLCGAPSYVQISGLRRLGTDNWPYSLVVWIYPTNITGGTIVHLSVQADGTDFASTPCLPMIGFNSIGQLAINSWNGSNISIVGPVVSLLSWTHVAVTYSSNNGQRLYINGTLYDSSAEAFDFIMGGVLMTITLGSSLAGTYKCTSGPIMIGQYQGLLDEFQLYARELTEVEITILSNP